MNFLMEFHISRQARDRYQFDEALFAQSGNVIFTNFHAVRVFAQRMNQKRDLIQFPEQAIRAGQINAMGLIDEILHMVVGQFRQQRNPRTFEQALAWLYRTLGKQPVDQALRRFAEDFPPLAVYRRQMGLQEYFEGFSADPTGELVLNRQMILEEMLLLWLANANPAFGPYLDLFDDNALEKETAYPQIISGLSDFFETQPLFGPDNQNLVTMLRSPAVAVPYSLPGQLEYIRSRWGLLLGKLLYRLFSSFDLIREEEKITFLGPGPARVVEFAGQEVEPERFSPDREWMPNLVLIAKNSYVWLDQLSKKYQRPINRLDQVPDEELDTLARWGFSGLWLIGLWERSTASRTIKQLRGNQEAVASAYSLCSYEIAGDLGGEEAYQDLRQRAWQRGIRLASDMVPNHMGIDSNWVMEHPDWFISLGHSPFPSYTFSGPDLSPNPGVGIFIEDHYFNNTDAAVVFQRQDRGSGQARYIYHGNDGTSMPWNDTAQLDYLKAEVREAVIQTILHVARKFPIIRFDAAMTLAKKHFQRLWYPEPGTGGAIPSRSDFGLTREQFDAAMPLEFWREVVNRVQQEAPDTLLLAEAFWLMEGYFVRTLGMHRVYNSAFMNMLRDEKNAEYRLVIKNTLEFDPEILKRYVNFMNNPDERTAVDQFGKNDKYFGVCVMMATMPGLPMFGHGQIEGLTERYGMEYRRAYWDEHPDPYLVERHEREVFPLLRQRWLFAEVQDFLLFDFYASGGYVNEDVFAYSNRAGHERTLVVYHNKYAEASGWIRTSVSYAVKHGPGERTLANRTLGEGLGLDAGANAFTVFRDQITGLEYIRSNPELLAQGLYVELGAYKYHVFTNFYQVQDNEWRQYAQLCNYLRGSGVPSVEEALKEIFLQPIHTPFRELVNAGMFQWLIENRWQAAKLAAARKKAKAAQPAFAPPTTLLQALDEAGQKSLRLLGEIKHLTHGSGDEAAVAAGLRRQVEICLSLPFIASSLSASAEPAVQALGEGLARGPQGKEDFPSGDPAAWGVLFAWLFIHDLGKMVADEASAPSISRSWIDEWLLGKITGSALEGLGLSEAAAGQGVALVRLLTEHCELLGLTADQENTAESDRQPADNLARPLPTESAWQTWFASSEVQSYLGVNRYQGLLWFNHEAFTSWLWWQSATTLVEVLRRSPWPDADLEPAGMDPVVKLAHIMQRMRQAESKSGYQVEALVERLKILPD